MRLFFTLFLICVPIYIMGFITGYKYLDNQNQFTKGYDTGMCAIVKTVTGRPKCEVKEIQTMSGETIRAAISLPN